MSLVCSTGSNVHICRYGWPHVGPPSILLIEIHRWGFYLGIQQSCWQPKETMLFLQPKSTSSKSSIVNFHWTSHIWSVAAHMKDWSCFWVFVVSGTLSIMLPTSIRKQISHEEQYYSSFEAQRFTMCSCLLHTLQKSREDSQSLEHCQLELSFKFTKARRRLGPIVWDRAPVSESCNVLSLTVLCSLFTLSSNLCCSEPLNHRTPC
jgi:hypothetical protein